MGESRRERSSRIRRRRLALEPLEPRVLLSSSLTISEFMALNHGSLLDSFGDSSDWVEIHNAGTEAESLDGWFLTDDPGDLTKWRFPDETLEAGGYLVVFASGRDIAQPGEELHTNFALGSDGEYLALVEPDGATVASEFAPRYPDQRADISYGIGQEVEVTSILGPQAPCTVYVSATQPPPPNWAERTFDDSGWLAGTTGVGYEQSVPGFAVWTHKANLTVGNLDVAEEVAADPAKRTWTEAANSSVINFFNTGGHGHYDANEVSFPGLFINQNTDDYVVHVTADLLIPSAGQWTIGANTDDGFRLTIAGATTSAVTNSTTPAGGDTISYYNPRGPGDTLGVFDFPAAGSYPLEVVFYERGGGSELEVFAAPGAHSSWNASDFDLIGDTANGGLAAEAQVVGSGSAGGYGDLIGTDVQGEMFGATASAFIRVPFEVPDPGAHDSLVLRINYDDGFVAWLNGVEVARRNAPATVYWNSPASAEHPDQQALVPEEIDISDHVGLLEPGTNVLALQGLNYAPDDSDFLIVPELVDVEVVGVGEHYFATPTPGFANSTDYYKRTAGVEFSHPHGFYQAPFELSLTSRTEGAEIRYTLDGSTPTLDNGTVYSGPIEISGTTVVRAAAFKEGHEPGDVRSQTYIFLDDVLAQSPDGQPPATEHLVASFDSGPGAFAYADDLFGGTANPDAADGDFQADGGSSGGGLHVRLGPGPVTGAISGGWSTTFAVQADTTADVSVAYRLVMADPYESSEFGEVILEVDGTRYGGDLNGSLLHAAGDNQANGDFDSGWQTASFSVALAAGNHTLSVGAYNSGASAPDEYLDAYFDDISAITHDWPSGPINSQVLDYGMDPDIVNDPTWGPQLEDALLSIPSISLVTDLDNLFDPATGIYVNARQEGAAWERPVSVELIDPEGDEGFQINAGLRIRGGYSRSPKNPKHAFRLFFRSDYGESKLRYPLFGDEGVDEFDKVDLRTSQNYSWSFGGSALNTMNRDVFSRDLQREMGQPYTRSRYYHVYVNGQYWGLYQSQERSEAAFGESYLGGDREDYDTIKAEAGPYTVAATDGNLDAWRDLWDQAKAGFASDEAYYRAQGLNPDGTRNPDYPVLLDVDNLIDYMIAIFYGGNKDAPISNFLGNEKINNWYGLRDRTGDEGFVYFAHDAEHTLLVGDLNIDRTGPWPAGDTFEYSNPQWLHQELMANPEYRMRFADRVHKYFFNDGILTPERATELFMSRAHEIEEAIIAESARWGDAKRSNPRTKTDWLNAINDIVNNYFPYRSDIVLEQFRTTTLRDGTLAPLYPSVAAPTFNQHGGEIEPGFLLFMAAPSGTIYYTLDGTDPRLPGGAVSPSALVFDSSTTTTALVSSGAAWKYLDDGSDQGTAWREPTFSDASWAEGPAQLGYGDGDEATVVSYGPDSRNKFVTTYFRRHFTVAEPESVTDLTLRLLRDDGAIVYLNGVEIARSNMPGGSVNSQTLASSTVGGAGESTFYEFTVDPELLREGDNVLAVEVHQGSRTSSDISFDLELVATSINGTPIELNESSHVKARVLDGGEWSALNEATFMVSTPTPVRITELMYHPEAPASGSPYDADDFEFIEITNTGGQGVDLTGARFNEGVDFVFPTTVLAPGERVVVVANQAAFEARYGVGAATIVGEYTGRLSNGGETLELDGPFGEQLARFTYDDEWYPVTDGDGFSLVLADEGIPQDGYEDKFAWMPSESRGGSPGQADTGQALSAIVINEIHYDPDVKTELVEFVELYNGGPSDVGLGGCYFSDGIEYVFPQGASIPSGGYLVLAQDGGEFEAKFGFAPFDSFEGRLANEGERVVLRAPDGSKIDQVDYKLGFPWPIVGDPPGRSMELVNPAFDNDLGGSWRPGGPTPGAPNSVLADNIPPHMRQVDHDPDQPTSGQAVTITVKATDPDGVDSVVLEYQLVDPGNYIALDDPEYDTTWTPVPMHDDGLNGDAEAGDDVYTVVLPGFLQTHRRLVRYRITATDETGLSLTAPYPEDPVPNFAYFVYDGVPSWSGAIEPGSADPERSAAVTYDSDLLTTLPVYHLIAKEEDVEDAQFIPDSDRSSGYGGSDYPWSGTLVYDGEVYDHVHFRARGGVWRYAMGKNMWKFDFNRGHPFQARDNYGEKYDTTWDKLNFSACIQQGNYLHRGEQGMFEAVGFKLFNLAGVEAPNTHYVHFRVIDEPDEAGPTQYDGDFWGLYLAVEQMDGNFLDEHDLPDGNLYKMEGGTGELNNQGPTQPTDKSDLNAFMDTYEDTTPSDEWWRQNLDLERYYSYRTIVEAIHHYDIGAGKNYFYYHNPETDAWQVHPWDIDLTWADNMYGNGNEPFKSRVLSRPDFYLEYQNRARELCDLLYNPDQAGRVIDEIARFIYDPAGGPSFVDADRAMWDYNPIMVSSYVKANKAGQGRFYESSPTGDFPGMLQLMKDYVVSRGAWIDSHITHDPLIPDTPSLTYVGPEGFPADRLTFSTTPFSGAGNFAAMEWRIAEVTDPDNPTYDLDEPWLYEINSLWESGELTTFQDEITIPRGIAEPGHSYRVRVRMKDDTGRWSHWSEPEEFIAGEQLDPLSDHIRITEVMYHPEPPPGGSPFNDEDFEFIELKNIGDEPLDLAGIRITEDVDFTFPAIELGPGQHVLVVSNLSAFQSRYDTSAMTIAGEFTGHLANGEGEVELKSALGEEILEVEYKDSWYPITDGEGFSLVVVDEQGAAHELEERGAWRPSAWRGGSPGADDPGYAPGSVVINEVLTHTDASPVGDWLELHNTTGAPMDISGWFISDDPGDLAKFRIPDGTVVPADGYVVFSEFEDFGPSENPDTGFGFSELGESACLTSAAPDGTLGGYREQVQFGAADHEVPFGRYLNSVGDVHFVALSAATPADENAYPLVGPVVFNEIMYNPAEGGDEFIELLNIADQPVQLYDPANPSNTWSLAAGVEFTFPEGVELAAGERILVVGIEPDVFRSTYGIPAEVRIFGPWAGALDNKGEAVELYKPGDPEPGGFVPQILVERVRYDDKAPWPDEADGQGAALARWVPAEYGNDPANWRPSPPGGTPGAENQFVDSTPPTRPSELAFTSPSSSEITVTWEASADDESGVAFYRVVRDGLEVATTAETRYDDSGLVEDRAYVYQVIAVNGDGYESEASEPLVASPRPSLREVRPLDETHVAVIFGKVVEPASAELVANYSVLDASAAPLPLLSATLQGDGRSVVLTLGEALVEDASYTATVSDVRDAFGNTVAPGSRLDFVYVAWEHDDIGAVAVAGDMDYSDGTFTVQASGADIWGYNDEFHYVYRPFQGDGEVIARVVSLTNTDSWAKAGVMFRGSLEPDASFAMTVVTPGHGVAFQWRANAGGGCSNVGTSGAAPYWVRLVRDGDTFTAYASPNGSDWTLIGSDSVFMGSDAYVGLAVTAHNDGAVATAVFDNVSVTLYQPPTLTSIAPLTGATEGEPFTITYDALLAASDAADPNADELSFRVETLATGQLTKDGQPVVPGTTLLGPSESLVWTPPEPAVGDLEAFSVVAFDGRETSASPVPVVVSVAERVWYLVGDVYPHHGPTDDAGDFGDGVINNADLLLIWYWSQGVDVDMPEAGSDRWNAADAYYNDMPDFPGGDGLVQDTDLRKVFYDALIPGRPLYDRSRTSEGWTNRRHEEGGAQSAALVSAASVSSGSLPPGLLAAVTGDPAPLDGDPDIAPLVISEFLADNYQGLADEEGDHPDWIEIHNPNDRPVALDGWFLTDDPGDLAKWPFPPTTIAANDYLVVFASGKHPTSLDGGLHTNFQLDDGGEYLALVNPEGLVVSEYDPSYPPQLEDVSYGLADVTLSPDTLVGEGANLTYLVPADDTLGLSWTGRAFDDADWTAAESGIGYDDEGAFASLIATDVASDMSGVNSSIYARAEFELPAQMVPRYKSLTLRVWYDDGFVAYLNGVEVARRNAPASLAHDSAATGEHPDDAAIAPEEVDITDFVGQLEVGTNVLAIHGLNLAADDPDFLLVPQLVGEVVVSGECEYFTTPTPRAENAEGALGVLAPVEFSAPAGFYDTPFDLVLSSSTPGAEIRYTLDGTEPTATSGLLYSSPIHITTTTFVRSAAFKTGYITPGSATRTYVFLDDVLAQDGAGLPDNWGHAGADYAMDPDVVNDPAYAATIRDDLKSIPTLSLVMDFDDLFGGGGQGIYIRGEGSERACSAELLYPDGRQGFQVNCAVQIQGGTSTNRWKVDKLSMRLKFKRPYGPTKLDFPLFEDSEVAEFDTLIVDAMMNLSWLHPQSWQRRKAQYCREQFVDDLQNALGGYAPHGRYVHLYLNGLYWGLYWLHERPDESFAESYFGGQKEDYDVLKHTSNTVVNGSKANYHEMLDIAAAGLASDEQYQLIGQYLDIPNFIDYMLVNFYVGNTDWAHHNWYATRDRLDPNSRWRFHTWDAEHVLKGLNDDVTGKNNSGAPTFIHQQLCQNAEYRMLFADHVHRAFFNDGPMTPQNALAFYLGRLNEVDRAVVGESARWGDNRRPDDPYTHDDEWAAERDWLINTYFPQRTAIVLDQLRARGLYPDVAAPTFNQQGGAVEPGFALTMSAPAGTVWYTLDGSDPRLPGGAPSPDALVYDGTPVAIGQDLTVKARALDGGEWSALNEAAFTIDNSAADRVLITEIMYHPASEDEAEEFIELHNAADTPVGLGGWQFTKGVDYQLPPTAYIPAHGYLVVAADPDVFAAKYPTVTNFVGGWDGKLSNQAETIELVDADGDVVDTVSYADEGDWGYRERGPLDHGHRGWIWSADHDGGGKSAELINLALPNDYGQNWAASIPDDGTPGAPNSVADDDIAPLILDVEHDPPIPNSDDPVSVTAEVIDELDTGIVATLWYRLDGAADFTAVAMADDGAHGDGEAGDGVFGASIPAQADGSVVEFYVEARDAGGLSRTWPAPTQPSGDHLTNALYQVLDSFDQDAPWDPESQPVYYLIMTEAERAEIADIGDGGGGEEDSNAQMNATFISVGGTGVRVRYTVGVRNRGHGSRSRPPNNYRVNFVSDSPWNGVRALNINSKYTHSQVIGSAIYRLAGLPAADAIPVQVRVNGQNLAETNDRMFGSYAAVEVKNSDYAERHFPADGGGNVYKCFRTDGGGQEADLRYEGTNPDAYRDTYFKSTNDELDDWSDLIHLTDVLNNSPDETFLDAISQVINVEEWMRYLALDTLMNNWETGLNRGIGDDYALYRGVQDPRFVLVPHDLDTLMDEGNQHGSTDHDIFTFTQVAGLERLLTHPQTAPLYFAALTDLLENFFNHETLDPLLDQVLGGWVAASTINDMKQFIDDRRAGVIPQIPGAFTATSDLDVANGYFRTADGTVSVHGQFDPALTRSVTVNGVEADLSPRDGTWSLPGEDGGGGGAQTVVLLPAGSVWKYLDDGSDQGTAWRASDFDDSTWAAGPAQLGYGDGDEATVVSYGPNSGDKYATTYFRTSFDVADPSQFSSLTLRLVRDDGAAVYLNGSEVARDKLDPDAGFNDYATGSAVGGSDESRFYEFTVDPARLVPGRNVLAVEIHQISGTSSDISFDLELTGLIASQGGQSAPLDLNPGINRLVVQGFDEDGDEVHRESLDVWYDVIGVPPAEHYNLDLVTRDSYLPGIPFLVRVEARNEEGEIARSLWDATAALSTDNPAVTLSTTEVELHNGIGTALVTATGSGDFTLTATLDEQSDSQALVSLEGQPVSEVAGTLSDTNTVWNGIIHVTGDLIVPDGFTLTIEPGTLVLLDGVSSGTDGADIDVAGSIQSLGTAESPVTFTAWDPSEPWGEIHHNMAAPSLYEYTNIALAGNSPGGGHTGTGPAVRAENSSITFEHSAITDLVGKTMQTQGADLTFRDCVLARSRMGPEIEGTALLFEDSFLFDMHGPDDADGIYIHSQQAGQTVTLTGGAAAFTDDDGIDTLASTVTVEDMIIRDANDKGISIYDEEVFINRCLIVDNSLAAEDGTGSSVSAKGNSGETVTVHIDRTTIVGRDIGIEGRNKYGVPDVVIEYYVTSSIILADDAVTTDYDPADIHISYSDVSEDWPGTGNINSTPLFVNPAGHDYRLGEGSPCIDTGDPSAPTDPDGSRADMGSRPAVQTERVYSGGELAADTTWEADAGPYVVQGDLVVPAGLTLTILPGTTVFFEPGAGLTVNGRLVAVGTEYERVYLTLTPGQSATWDGLAFANTLEDNQLSHVHMSRGDGQGESLNVDHARLTIDGMSWSETSDTIIEVLHPSLIVRNSYFPDTPDEPIHGEYIEGSEYFIIEGNVFARNTSGGDVIDFLGAESPGPVLQVLNNVFLGGGDDGLDLDGADAYVEGNIFTNFHLDTSRQTTSNAVSTGRPQTGGENRTEVTLVRNIFYDNDHALLVKDESFATLVNNTIVGSSLAAVQFDEPGGSGSPTPGRGAFLDGNILWDNAEVFQYLSGEVDLTIDRSIVPAAFHSYGTGNLDEDPRLASPGVGDPQSEAFLDGFRLRPGSAALGTGPNGLDMGALVPSGASISGEPAALTARDNATLLVGGPGVVSYEYRLNSGDYGPETPVDTPITLSGLADGDYTVYVLGKNAAGVWQAEPTASHTWTVDSSLRGVELSEIVAINSSALAIDGTFPDYIELHNPGASDFDLGGLSITDDPADPTKFVFSTGTVVPAGGYMVVYADDGLGPGIHLGFNLDGEGEGVWLFDDQRRGGALLDSVEFGLQLPDLAIARVGHDGRWALAAPTPGAGNVAARTGDPSTLKLNEWFADGEVRFTDDFVELYNPDRLPVALGGLLITDDVVAAPARHSIPELSFVAGSGCVALDADGREGGNASHLPFKLSSDQELLGLVDPDGERIDVVLYYPQTTDISQGRSPDGATPYEFFRLPTPGLPNPVVTSSVVGALPIDATWAYDQSGDDLGTGWRAIGYDDSAWPTGQGVLGHESSALPEPIRTDLSLGPTTYYFRTHFTVNADPQDVNLSAELLLDDGAVVYLNGEEVLRVGMPSGPVDASTLASRTVDNAAFEGPFALPTASLTSGDNLLAVEVHQCSTGSSDVVFGMRLEATATSFDPDAARALGVLDGLRVTELMYHPSEDPDLEFIELKNISGQALDLTGVRLDGGVEFTFPAMALAPGEYVVVVRDLAEFQARYGAGVNVAGEYSGNLSDGGEGLVLRPAEPYDAAALRFDYNDNWYPETDGGGYSLVARDAAAQPKMWDKALGWAAGAVAGGTPGAPDGSWVNSVVINEVLSHTDPPLSDSIELHNATAEAVAIGGWFLSDSGDDYQKFRIPDGTFIPPAGYVVFDEGDFNNSGDPLKDFALDGAHGDELWLTTPEGQVVDHVAFGAARNGESFGRWPDGSGALYPMTSRTLGSVNSGPRVGPLVISELMYHPPDPGPGVDPDDLEFIEIYNPTAQAVDLTHWRIAGGVDFAFADGTTIEAYSALVAVSFDPTDPANADRLADFQAAYGAVDVVGGYSGKLSNNGETVQLLRPDEPPADEPSYYPMLLEDEVAYDDAAPWPTEADGDGGSLVRAASDAWGDDPASWSAAAPSPGEVEWVQPVWYLVGDVYPHTGAGDAAGDFGDGVIDNADLVVVYHWSLGSGGDVPAAGSARWNAADVAGPDDPPLAGGDGVINAADVRKLFYDILLPGRPLYERGEVGGELVSRLWGWSGAHSSGGQGPLSIGGGVGSALSGGYGRSSGASVGLFAAARQASMARATSWREQQVAALWQDVSLTEDVASDPLGLE